jgi:translation initiation factor IF-3
LNAFKKAGSAPTGDNNSSRFNQQRPPVETHRINRRIRAREVRVISDSGEQLGVKSLIEAVALAEELRLDLVEVSPNAVPPVCKLMDYGKFKYREQKKLAEARKKRSEVVIKELRIRYRTDKGDLDTKLKKARQFLEEGDKVKFSMRFRGREIVYTNLGAAKFAEIAEALKDVGNIDDQSPAQGRQIHITFSPLKSAIKAPTTEGEA